MLSFEKMELTIRVYIQPELSLEYRQKFEGASINYTFTVDNVKYHRFSTTLYCTDCGNSCCVVGDTVIVKYQKGNSKNSALVYKSARGEKLYY